ncbi:MAG: hypothetical protein AAFU55_15265, partial [Pseudomonadota bacterium]
PMARKADLQNWFVPMLDSEADSVFSISIPPPALAFAAEMVRETPLKQIPGGEKIAELVGQLDGRIGYVGFDSPGDWALAMRFNTPEAAAAFAPALQKVIDNGLKAAGVEDQDFVLLEEFPGAGKTMHLRPDALLDGFRVAAIGANVVTVPRTMRLSRLLEANGGKKKSKVSKMIAGPLTPLVKRTLDTPSLALAYTLMSGDGAIFDYFLVPAKGLELGLNTALDMLADSPEMASMAELSTLGLKRLPLSLAVGMVGWLVTYDFAAAIDVRDTVLVLELVSSQI